MSSDLSIAKISVNRIAGSKFQFSPSLLSTNQLYLFTTKLFASFYTPLHTLLFHHIHFARTNFLKISITKISTFPYIKKKKENIEKIEKNELQNFIARSRPNFPFGTTKTFVPLPLTIPHRVKDI